jgi:hypothetical protein
MMKLKTLPACGDLAHLLKTLNARILNSLMVLVTGLADLRMAYHN